MPVYSGTISNFNDKLVDFRNSFLSGMQKPIWSLFVKRANFTRMKIFLNLIMTFIVRNMRFFLFNVIGNYLMKIACVNECNFREILNNISTVIPSAEGKKNEIQVNFAYEIIVFKFTYKCDIKNMIKCVYVLVPKIRDSRSSLFGWNVQLDPYILGVYNSMQCHTEAPKYAQNISSSIIKIVGACSTTNITFEMRNCNPNRTWNRRNNSNNKRTISNRLV